MSKRRAAGLTGALALVIGLGTACTDAGGAAGPRGTTPAANVEHATSQVQSHRTASTSVKAPAAVIPGLDKLRGKTVGYIPITLKATYFQAQLEQLTEALTPLGVHVQACDAQAQPTVATQCLNQAVAAGSAGIITDSLPFALARNAYAAATSANIPVVAADVSDALPPEWRGKILETNNGQDVGSRLMADAIISDSKGSANVLFANTTSTSTTQKSSDAVQDEFAKFCQGCKVTTVAWDATAVQKIPTAVSVALNADPSIDYVFASYDQPAGPLVIQGMQLSGRNRSLKLVGYGADVSAMQRISTGAQLADVAADPALVAWNNADRLLRMTVGQQPPGDDGYTTPRRVFDSTNIRTVNGSSVAAFKDGSWFTDGSFRKTYQQLWGVPAA
ncbi:sugar ABC transporter substrate-binding protein [Amycolatopsis sp. cmx-4-61]|uniref:sugar ABC transporter substrate-binding protein n=1 Tax=Amycolatopsis sp. cmx-4-61 TaxID=2790937 RepID=UPI00397A7D0E